MKIQRVIRTSVKWLASLLAGLGVLLALLFGLAQTRWAKDRLAAHLTQDVGGYQIRVRQVEGLLPFSLQVGAASVADSKGPFLRFEALHLAWNPLALLAGHVLIYEVSAERAVLLRNPIPALEGKTESPRSAAAIPAVDITLQSLRCSHFEIRPPLVPEPTVFRLEGQARYREPQQLTATVLAAESRADRGIRLRLLVTGKLREQQLIVDAEAKMPPENPLAQALIPPQIAQQISLRDLHATLDIDVDYSKDLRLQVNESRIGTPEAEIMVHGTILPKQKTLDMYMELPRTPLHTLLQRPPLSARGNAQANIRLSGSFPRLSMEARVQLLKLSVGNLPVSTVIAAVKAPSIPQTLAGSVEASFMHADTRASLAGEAEWKDERLSLSGLDLRGPATQVNAEVTLLPAAKTINARLEGKVRDLNWLQPFVERPVAGSVVLQMAINGPWLSPSLDGYAKAENLQFGPLSADLIRIESTPQGPSAETGSGTLLVKGAALGAFAFDRLHLALTLASSRADFNLALKGQAALPFALDSEGVYKREDTEQTLVFNQGKGYYGPLPFSWSSPVTLVNSLNGNQSALRAPSISLGGGELSLEASLNDTRLDGRVKAESIAMKTLPLPISFAEGILGGNASVSGTLLTPQLKLSLNAEKLRPSGVPKDQWSLVELAAEADIGRERMRASLKAINSQDDQLNFSAELPMELSLKPLRMRTAGDLRAEASIDAELESFSPLVLPPGQRLGGSAKGKIRIVGPLEQPRINGRVEVQDGEYENARTGTVLSDITLQSKAEGRLLEITRFTAGDGEDGKASGQGQIEFPAGGHPLVQLALQWDTMKLLRKPDATAAISGRSRINIAEDRAEFSGSIEVDSVEVRIPEPAPKGMKGITVLRPSSRQQEKGVNGSADDSSALPPFHLDATVSLPAQCFVRGRGLDSEWQGNLQLSGTAKRPSIQGEMTLVRGSLTFLAKHFELRRGTIQFQNETPPRPLLHIVAVHARSDLQVTLTVSGPANDPELQLSSAPVYPRDEILARLMFGRSLAEISPLQAVKLALAARTLMSGDSSVLDRLRKGIGLDTLSLKAQGGEGGGTVVGVGKYLNEDIYFQVERGTGEASTRVSVEVEITPHLSVESTAGAVTQGIEFKWRYRY